MLIRMKILIFYFFLFRFLRAVFHVIFDFIKFSRNANVVALFTKLVEKNEDKTLFYYQDIQWTIKEVRTYVIFRVKIMKMF